MHANLLDQCHKDAGKGMQERICWKGYAGKDMLGRVCWKGSGSIAHLAGLTAGNLIGVALGVKGVKPVHCIVCIGMPRRL